MAPALGLFGLQLLLNTIWSWLFFGRQSPGAALVEVVFFLAAIVATTMVFLQVNPVAGWLMVPYIAWVSFATILNLEIWRLNRG
ncbi:MAG: TspO/MBR family protein [Gemmatimonadota bacterium]